MNMDMYSMVYRYIVLQVFDFKKEEIRIYDSLAIYKNIEANDMDLLR